jgi:hypothetical protein
MAGTLRIALLSAVAALIAVGSADAQSVVTLEHAVRNCRLIGDRATRLSCYDDVIDSATPVAVSAPPIPPAPAAHVEVPKAPSAPVQASIAPPAPPSPAAAPPAPAKTVAIATPPAAPAPAEAPRNKGFLGINGGNPNDVTTTVVSAQLDGNSMLHFTLADGTSWDQTDGTEITQAPQPGEPVLITKNSFGKHRCKLVSSTLFDCKPKS